MRVLITGANGFVGRHLIRLLETLAPPPEITAWVWDGDPAPAAASTSVRVDLRRAADVAAALEKAAPEVVYHLAAAASVAASWREPALAFDVNLRGTATPPPPPSAAEPPPLVVVATSGEVYGPTDPAHRAREDDPLRPLSPYAFSKAGQDQLAASCRRPPVVRLRPFAHTGPGQPDRFALPSFARQIAAAEAGLQEPRIAVGNLDAVRDVADVRDVVRAYPAVATLDHAGRAYNVATGRGHRIGDLLELLCGLARCRVEVVRDPALDRPADVPRLVGDAARLTAATGWEPRTPLATTLADLLEWWRRRLATLEITP